MLAGARVRLRAIEPSDAPTLRRWLADPGLWQLTRAAPVSPGSLADAERAWSTAGPESASFAVDAEGGLIGACGVFGIDLHNSTAEVGLWLGDPATRGQGYGAEVLALLVDYGFRLRGLHRLEIETLATNGAMRRIAERAGFTLAGTLREAAWVDGGFVDVARYDLLASDPGARRVATG